ncbi:uncharacterized protein PV09_08917 [Verruconis gallopava]|uniref:Uncharacterized protein n=1 Tax=Verruconis gallopava TaxID=253628 RepID=A0A0D1ZY19_9PEZI|nr:uncharacterized protein PV09_08917 [Verruconis gallopava]KIV99372.1 hypothetical protein PV09_08917 [Verruconis gallopava]
MAAFRKIEFLKADGFNLREFYNAAGDKELCIIMSNWFTGTKEPSSPILRKDFKQPAMRSFSRTIAIGAKAMEYQGSSVTLLHKRATNLQLSPSRRLFPEVDASNVAY